MDRRTDDRRTDGQTESMVLWRKHGCFDSMDAIRAIHWMAPETVVARLKSDFKWRKIPKLVMTVLFDNLHPLYGRTTWHEFMSSMSSSFILIHMNTAGLLNLSFLGLRDEDSVPCSMKQLGMTESENRVAWKGFRYDILRWPGPEELTKHLVNE